MVYKRIKRTLSWVLLFATLFSFVSCNMSLGSLTASVGSNSYSEYAKTVKVAVADGEHYKVNSENPINVQIGKNVSFDISIDEAYEYVSNSEGGRYIGGKLTLTKVFYPMTVELTVEEKEVDIILPDLDPETPEDPEKPEDPIKPEEPEVERKTVVLSAEAKEGYRFICWTLDRSAEEGGEVFALDAEGTFQIPVGSEAVANYVDDAHYVILYRTNGGTVAENGNDYYYQTFSNEHYLMPNTIHQNGTFVRNGYSLLRYTENKDGSGDYTTLGGKITVNENGFVELWLQWGKNTTSGLLMSVSKDEGSGEKYITVKEYTGDADDVVIPAYISGYPVKKILKGAFSDKNMKSLYLPETIDVIEDGAFVNCTSLTELTVHDTFTSVKDAAFSDCTSLSTYYLNAGRLPVHAGEGEGMFCIKYERLRSLAASEGKKIIVFSGSSSLYGFLAQQMQEAFYGEYSVVNYGTNAGVNICFYMEAFMEFYGEGDIIIQAPETTSSTQLGVDTLAWRVFRGCECMYEVFSYVDMRNYTLFFDSLSEFNVDVRGSEVGKSYESWSKFLNEYSDMTTNKDAQINNPSYLEGTSTANPFNVDYITAARVNKLNGICTRVRAKGVQMYMSWAPVNKNYCNATALSKSTQKAFKDKMQSMIDYTVISEISDYILEGKYFNNSNYHPGPTGAAMRTTKLIADLKAQLEYDGIWNEAEHSS